MIVAPLTRGTEPGLQAFSGARFNDYIAPSPALRAGDGVGRIERSDPRQSGHGHAEHERPPRPRHAAPESLSALSTSSALSRSSGLFMTLMYFTVPVLSMM